MFAAYKHSNQRSKDVVPSPYLDNPIALVDVLANKGRLDDERLMVAAVLHDTLEDTQTTERELDKLFGKELADLVKEVTDDKSLPIAERKRLQIVHAKTLSRRAKLVKLADKICNLRDMAHAPPAGWGLARRQDYFDWAKQVIDEIRGVHPTLERIFDEAYTRRPTAASPEPH